MGLRPLAIVLALAFVLAAGCAKPAPEAGPSPSAPASGSAATMTLASAAFKDGAPIPTEHTCDGASVSPPLSISGAPAVAPEARLGHDERGSSMPSNASTIALTMLDDDVPIPQAPQREVVHWIWWNARVGADGTLDVPKGGVANGTVQGNGAAGTKYAGPCPPEYSTAHRYVFTAYAVPGALNLKEGASKDELVAALADHTLATAKLTGTYARLTLPS